jgi:hypothetical protein
MAVVAVAAILIGLLAVETAPASSSGGPTAAVAKKKKKKAIKKATKYIAGGSFTAITSSGGTIAPSSTTRTISFCHDGTYAYKLQNDSYYGASQDSFNGTWKVTKAKITKTAAGAIVNFTAANFQSFYFDGSPGPGTAPPPSGQFGIAVQGNAVYITGFSGTFTRSSNGC